MREVLPYAAPLRSTPSASSRETRRHFVPSRSLLGRSRRSAPLRGRWFHRSGPGTALRCRPPACKRPPQSLRACHAACERKSTRHAKPSAPRLRSQMPDAVLVNCGCIRLLTASFSCSGRKPSASIVPPLPVWPRCRWRARPTWARRCWSFSTPCGLCSRKKSESAVDTHAFVCQTCFHVFCCKSFCDCSDRAVSCSVGAGFRQSRSCARDGFRFGECVSLPCRRGNCA